jgi:hypothetical protein
MRSMTLHALDGRHYGRRLYRFVVIADTHVNQEEGRSSSPYAVNALANERTRAVIDEINRLAPAFVVHVGDIVHPVPELPSYPVAVDQFKALAKGLKAPLHLTPGNHDVGDKPVEWMPAGHVTQEAVDLYRKLLGRDYYAFDAEGCHFVVIDAQIINSGLPCETEQRAWLEADLAAHSGRRSFWCIHYPPFVTFRDEPSSYDNIDEPGRTWLLDLMERHRPEALFAGHVHNLWYDVHGGTECYILPSTAFVRHDYAEMYRIEPGPEEGRNDAAKLGYFIVDVHERGHVCHWIRTGGALMAADAFGRARPERLDPVHTKTNTGARIGVDLKHAWAEVVEIAATGGVQEFERKRVRNDYPVHALWEMGIRHLRVPIGDLLDPAVRARMQTMVQIGHRFTVASFDVPRGKARDAIVAHRELVDALEVVVPWRSAPAAVRELAAIRRAAGCRILVSKSRKHEDAKFDGARYNHFINHGFVPAEREQIAALLDAHGARGVVDGFVFRVIRDHRASDALPALAALGTALGTGVAAIVRLAADNPAERPGDPLACANRVADTVLAAAATPSVETLFDTFEDVDRGYFARAGFIDRRGNPHLALRVVRHLHAVLGTSVVTLAAAGADAGVRWQAFTAGTRAFTLVLSDAITGAPFPALPGATGWIDLGRGEIHPGAVPDRVGVPMLVTAA